MARIAFLVHGGLAPFSERDVQILQTLGHDVEVTVYRNVRNMVDVARAVRRADAVFCWFADAHAALACRFARDVPVIVVVGGYEGAAVPEIGYGTWAVGSVVARATVRYALEHADVLLPVSMVTRQGVEAHARPTGAMRVVPNGVDPDEWLPRKKDGTVITVGRIDGDTYRRKGIATFVGAAERLPDVPFVLAGPVDEAVRHLVDRGIPNLSVTGRLPWDDLHARVGAASVYAQLSIYESFGVALLEGMSAECVPVVGDGGALPEVVGDTGLVVPYDDVDATIAAIEAALSAEDATRRAARRRVVERFSVAARSQALDEVLHAALRS